MSHEYVLRPFQAPARLQIDYQRELNNQQFAAVTALPGPSLVIAGAGSGKTRTLTYRVAYLIEQGIPAERILLLTFTNKAAREMMRRVTDLLGQELRSLWGGTFHGIGNRILRQHAQLAGYAPEFSIMDREDAKHLITACVTEAEIDTKALRFPKADVLAEVYSLAVNTHQSVDQVLGAQFDYFANLAPAIEDIRQRYVARKKKTNAMDFDDLLALWLKLLQTNAEILDHYQRRFQFILVDEYQDTNKLQSDVIDLMAARHRNLMVVGDDAQSIYAWRGADFANILRFQDRYPEAKIYKIETNYRSTPEILAAANAVITANTLQYPKVLTAARQPGSKPVVVACPDPFQQAAFVAQRVLELREEGENLNQMAVLYRSHFHALELQLELTKRGIPFSITSGIRFFEQAHIKDVTAYLKLVANPRDEIAFKRVAVLLPGIGDRGAAKLWNLLDSATGASGASLAETAPTARHPMALRLQGVAGKVPRKAAAAWAQFVATMAQLEAQDTRQNAARMIHLVIEAGYEEYLQENYDNYRSRIEDLQQLGSFAVQFAALDEFLTQLALLTNVEAEGNQAVRTDDEQIRLSTIHQAKGLEFDIVFLIMLCDGLFPSNRSLETTAGEEEERRLMYVALTRARNELYLSYPILRTSYEGAAMPQAPSRFLNEIPEHLVEPWNLRSPDAYG